MSKSALTILIALAILLIWLGLASAEEWDPFYDGGPIDDIECSLNIGRFRVLYTYHHSKKPKMPVEGMMCRPRDYEAEAKLFTEANKAWNESYEQHPAGKETPQ